MTDGLNEELSGQRDGQGRGAVLYMDGKRVVWKLK